MNAPWQNQAAPGFVYFNTNANVQNKADTNDFLAFNEPQTPSPKKWFSPTDSSTPQHFQRSPRHFNNKQNYKNRYSGGGYNNRSNGSPNGSFNKNRWGNPHHKRVSGGSNNGNQSGVGKFFEPTCLKDPWEYLERNLKPIVKQNEVIETIKQTTEDNSSSADTSDNDTET